MMNWKRWINWREEGRKKYESKAVCGSAPGLFTLFHMKSNPWMDFKFCPVVSRTEQEGPNQPGRQCYNNNNNNGNNVDK